MPTPAQLSNNHPGNNHRQLEKRNERRAIVFLSMVLAPVIAVAAVAGYGFVVWMYQMLAGPPGM